LPSSIFYKPSKWRKEASVGKTVVSSQLIDRVTAKLGESSTGASRFNVCGWSARCSLSFGGEESAGPPFLVWMQRLDNRQRRNRIAYFGEIMDGWTEIPADLSRTHA